MMPFNAWLTTRDAVLQHMDPQTESDAANDYLIDGLIVAASRLIHQQTRRSFEPWLETRTYDVLLDAYVYTDEMDVLYGADEGGRELLLDVDLLAVESLTNGDGTDITSDQYRLNGRDYPKYQIELLPSSDVTWTYEDDDWQDAIAVEGIWGYHADYGNAWIDTLDTVQDDPLSAGATTLTVTDANELDELARTRFAVGQLLKIEDEFLRVQVVNTSTNKLTVQRGVNGTTAAGHVQSTPIYRWQLMPDIEEACITLVIWLERHASSPGEEIQVMLNHTQVKSGQFPCHVRDTLAAYREDSVP